MAENNVQKIAMNKHGTLFHDVLGRSGAAKVLIKPAPSGTGIIAGGAIRAVVELAGFTDVYTKNMGKTPRLIWWEQQWMGSHLNTHLDKSRN